MKLSFLLFLAIFTGCAAKKQAKPSPAHLAIPSDCVMDTAFTKKSVCTAVPGDPDRSICSHMLVHHSCVRAIKDK